MQEDGKTFTFRRNIGEPIKVASEGGAILEVTPQAQALVIRWPSGGLVWNRPMAIWVRQGEQTDLPPTRVPITDVTRIAQNILLSLSIAFATISVVVSIKKSRRKSNG